MKTKNIFIVIFLIFISLNGCILFFMPGEYDNIISKVKEEKIEVKILILSPTNLQAFPSNNITILGKSESKNSIDKVLLKVRESGEFSIVDGKENWQTNLTLEENEYTIFAFCIDKSNNYSQTNSLKFFIDTTKPTIETVLPSNNQIFAVGEIPISNILTDNLSGVYEIFLRVNNDEFKSVKKIPSITRNLIFSSNIQITTDGTNSIEIFCSDRAGNKSTTNKITFLSTSSIPQITINIPNTNFLKTNTNIIFLSGTATDSLGIKNILIKLVEANTQYQLDNTNNWDTNITLLEGTNTINIYAVNLANLHSITQTIKVIVSTNAIISLNSPSNNQVTKHSSINIQGTASSYIGIKEVRIRLGDSGEFQVAQGKENWSTNISLSEEGEYRIYYYAIDELDNYSETNQTTFYFSQNIYVSSSLGNDTNIGVLKSSPLKTIQLALTKAVSLEIPTIKIQEGEYSPNNGLNSTTPGLLITNSILSTMISIIGGFDNNFLNPIGYSILNGNNNSNIIIMISNIINLSMANLVIIRGNAQEYSSGILTISDSKMLFLTNIKISNCGGNGKGIYIKNVSDSYFHIDAISNSSYEVVYIENTTNSTFYINAISNYNNTGLSRCVMVIFSHSNSFYGKIQANFAVDGNFYINNSTLNLISNETINNSTPPKGGGIFLLRSHSNRIISVISNNTTQNPTSAGGGIHLEESHWNRIESLISSNASGAGGGICLYSSHSNIINSEVFRNYSKDRGSGIYLINSYWNTISGIISRNYSSTNGGGIAFWESHSNIIYGTISSNGSGYYGGGIWATNSSNLVISANIISNYGYYGGNYFASSYYITFSNSQIFKNSSYIGGGIYLSKTANVLINDTMISNNNSGVGGGGGINISQTTNILINNTAIVNNISDKGGGLKIFEVNHVTISNSQVSSNFSHINGAGIYVERTTNMYILNSTFMSNYSTNINSSILFFVHTDQSIANLMISNNIIGGIGNGSIGIYEDGTADLKEHHLIQNAFISNTLNFLYREFTFDRKITNNNDWTNINNTNLLDTTQSSTNNTLTNI